MNRHGRLLVIFSFNRSYLPLRMFGFCLFVLAQASILVLTEITNIKAKYRIHIGGKFLGSVLEYVK